MARFDSQVPVMSPYLGGRKYLLSRRPIDAPTSGLVFPTTTGRSSREPPSLLPWHRHSRHNDAAAVEAIVPRHGVGGCGPAVGFPARRSSPSPTAAVVRPVTSASRGPTRGSHGDAAVRHPGRDESSSSRQQPHDHAWECRGLGAFGVRLTTRCVRARRAMCAADSEWVAHQCGQPSGERSESCASPSWRMIVSWSK